MRHHLEVLAEHGVAACAGARHQRRRLVGLWKQIVADATGLVLEPVVDHPGSALGAAFAAGMGSGAFGGLERRRALRRRSAEPVLPRGRRRPRVYDERYGAYRALYEALKPAA